MNADFLPILITEQTQPEDTLWKAPMTHLKSVGYILWLFGFIGAHRFYYGKTVSGIIYFFTLGLLGIGWIIDLFLIPSMDRQADFRYRTGSVDYTVAWVPHLPGSFRHSPHVYGKVDLGFSLPADSRNLRAGRVIRFSDSQRAGQSDQQPGRIGAESR